MNRQITILMLALAAAQVSGCSSETKSPYGSPNRPIPLSVGTAESISVPVFSEAYYTFEPGTTDNYTIALTDGASDLLWNLVNLDSSDLGSSQICELQATAGDETCVTPLLNSGVTYRLIVMERDGVEGAATVTITDGASPTALTVGVPVDASIGAFGSAHFEFTATAAVHTITLANVNTNLRWSLFTAGDYPAGGPDAGFCSPSDSPATVSCEANDGAVLIDTQQYFLLVEQIGGSYADVDPASFTVEVTSP